MRVAVLVAVLILVMAPVPAWGQGAGQGKVAPYPGNDAGPTYSGGPPEGGQGPGFPPRGPEGGPGGEMGDEDWSSDRSPSLAALARLGLSEEQFGRLCAEAYDSLARANLLKAELANVRMRMICLQGKDRVDEKEAKELFAKKAEVEAEIFILQRTNKQILESILTDEQRDMLNRRPTGRRAPGNRP